MLMRKCCKDKGDDNKYSTQSLSSETKFLILGCKGADCKLHSVTGTQSDWNLANLFQCIVIGIALNSLTTTDTQPSAKCHRLDKLDFIR